LLDLWVPDPQIGAEVGVWRAETSCFLLRTYPRLRLLAVDSYPEGGMMGNESPEAFREAKQVAQERLAGFGLRGALWLQDSLEAARSLPDGLLDFVYLDASHWYQDVRNDLDAWIPKVRVGGAVMGHDFGLLSNRRFGWGVVRAVRELRVSHRVEPGTVWGFQKGS